MAVANVCGNEPHCKRPGTVSLLLGDGTGNFTLDSSPATGSDPISVADGDFNGDGRLDLAVAKFDSNTPSILLQAPVVTLSPGSLSFGNQIVETMSAPHTATVTNAGYATVNISGIAIAGTDPGDFSQTNTCPPNLPVGQSCTIAVTFTPVTGCTRTATVSISDDGGNSPQTIALTGTGLAVQLSKTNLNFGDVKVGKISPPKIVVLTNVGTTTLTITSIKATGKDNGDFSAGNTCHGSVSPGGTCNIVVRFIPTQMGLRTADVSINDDGGGSPQEISLKGTGT